MTIDKVNAWMKENNISGGQLGTMLTGRKGATVYYGWKKSGFIVGKYAKKLEQIMANNTPAKQAVANYTPGAVIVTASKPKPRVMIHHDTYNFCPYCGHKL